mmetsp:Transcript_31945/g.67986  ORF Transcript_31945/g.67986 Transcript_31945/m.67986 type:complete len:202 (-) Transcript_31945:122-727(-)
MPIWRCASGTSTVAGRSTRSSWRCTPRIQRRGMSTSTWRTRWVRSSARGRFAISPSTRIGLTCRSWSGRGTLTSRLATMSSSMLAGSGIGFSISRATCACSSPTLSLRLTLARRCRIAGRRLSAECATSRPRTAATSARCSWSIGSSWSRMRATLRPRRPSKRGSRSASRRGAPCPGRTGRTPTRNTWTMCSPTTSPSSRI